MRDYTLAIELDPSDADSLYYGRAEAYRLSGDKEKAIADYRIVIEQTEHDSLRTDAIQRLNLLEGE